VRKLLSTLVILSTTLCAMVPAPPASARECGGAPGLVFHSPQSVEALSPDEEVALEYLWRRECRVGSLSATERRAVAAAASRISLVLADPRVRDLVANKRDWIVEGSAGWERRDGVGLAVLERLRGASTPARVAVFSYAETKGDPCHTPLADGETNAYTMMGAPAVLLFRPYLRRAAQAHETAGDVKGLARTLLHESLHVLGYTHPDGPLEIGGVVYNNTVPAYFGCLADLWPDVEGAAATCHLAREDAAAVRVGR
jgi:hypothetical protein